MALRKIPKRAEPEPDTPRLPAIYEAVMSGDINFPPLAVAGLRDFPTEIVAAQGEAVRLFGQSLSPNTQRAYVRALDRFDQWRPADAEIDDGLLATWCGDLHLQGLSPATIKQYVAAVGLRCEVKAGSRPAGPLTRKALKAISEEGRTRGRGQARPITADEIRDVIHRAEDPLDKAICGLLFHCGLRRSEAAALQWCDVEPAANVPGALLVHVATSKTNRAGEETDVRLVKGAAAAALQSLRTPDTTIDDHVLGGLGAQSVGRRFTKAVEAAGIEGRRTAHSGRVGLASELTAKGASTTETMLAGGWKTSRMVAHYSAGARAERGAVAKYL